MELRSCYPIEEVFSPEPLEVVAAILFDDVSCVVALVVGLRGVIEAPGVSLGRGLLTSLPKWVGIMGDMLVAGCCLRGF